MPIRIGLPFHRTSAWDPLKVMRTFQKPLWLTKLTQFEYWNWIAFYSPIIPSCIYLGLKARSMTFFTAVNPACSFGGFLKENKWEVLKTLPKTYLPFSLNVELGVELPQELSFPLLAKPNSGQRGIGIVHLANREELTSYHNAAVESYLLQEFISAPLEFAVFYSRLPHEKKGKISSLTQKEFMSVEGDGSSSIRELMQKDVRYRLQIKRLESLQKFDLESIIPYGKTMLLEPLGNHCKGTKFVNANHLITEDLEQVFDKIMSNVNGFYYGRFDLKATSLNDLYEGKGIKILELNGVNSDPAHIFDPNFSLLKAYRDVYWHWNRMAQIAKFNIKKGVKPLPLKTVYNTIVNKFSSQQL